MICTKNMANETCMNWDDAFYGSVTVGERGQVVIPAEARADLGISPGDKLLVMKHPIYKGLMVAKIEGIRQFLDEFTTRVDSLEKQQAEETV